MSMDDAAHPPVFRVLMRFQGQPDRENLTQAFNRAIVRQPLLTSIVAEDSLGLFWKRADSIPEIQWHVGGLSDAQVSELPIAAINIREEAGVRCQVWQVDGGITILIDVHHACCDGQGARQLLGEWFGTYQQLIGLIPGELKQTTLRFDALSQRHVYRKPSPPIGFWEGLRNLYLTVRGKTITLNPRFPAVQPSEIQFERCFSEEETAQIRGQLKKNNVTINDVGLAAAFTVFAESYPELMHRGRVMILHPIDLRWPSDLRTPACNRVGIAYLRRKVSEIKNEPALLAGIRDEMKYIKNRYVGAEFLRGLAKADGVKSGAQRVQKLGWFVPTLQYTCLGDTTRALHHKFHEVDGVINFDGLVLDRISGFMQLGVIHPLSLTSCETNQKLTLTIRANCQYFNAELAQEFLVKFSQRIQLGGELS
ncbi:hypothetical protein SH668x_002284 [Planctomicrobium sp. SH668]|uniref:hypothetical protein n=1 Tax=Planctomicrobium sp. SH668 TaxID=3448126 RepID=UPI003F5B2C8C